MKILNIIKNIILLLGFFGLLGIISEIGLRWEDQRIQEQEMTWETAGYPILTK